jgi:hypothetical protein
VAIVVVQMALNLFFELVPDLIIAILLITSLVKVRGVPEGRGFVELFPRLCVLMGVFDEAGS